jgi:hypothetical protein
MNLTTKFMDEDPRLMEIFCTDNLETYECKIRENSRKKGLICNYKGLIVLGLLVMVKTEKKILATWKKRRAWITTEYCRTYICNGNSIL